MSNPLVAERVDSTTAFTGAPLLESIDETSKAIASGDWAAGIEGIAGVATEAIGFAMDPLAAIFSSGVGWLLEHVKPLSDALDKLTGDPDQINAHAETWANIGQELGSVSADMANLIATDTAGWIGEAGDAYRERGSDTATLIAAAQSAAEGAQSGISTAGEVVASVRTLVRDVIAELVGNLISWALQVVCTLGFGLIVVIPKVVMAVAKTAMKIAKAITKLVDAVSKLVTLVMKLVNGFGDVSDALSGIKGGKADKPSGGPGGGHTSPAGHGPSGGTDPAGSHTNGTGAKPDGPNGHGGNGKPDMPGGGKPSPLGGKGGNLNSFGKKGKRGGKSGGGSSHGPSGSRSGPGGSGGSGSHGGPSGTGPSGSHGPGGGSPTNPPPSRPRPDWQGPFSPAQPPPGNSSGIGPGAHGHSQYGDYKYPGGNTNAKPNRFTGGHTWHSDTTTPVPPPGGGHNPAGGITGHKPNGGIGPTQPNGIYQVNKPTVQWQPPPNSAGVVPPPVQIGGKPGSTMYPQGMPSTYSQGMGNQAWNYGSPNGGMQLPPGAGPGSNYKFNGQAQIPYTPIWNPGGANHGAAPSGGWHNYQGQVINHEGWAKPQPGGGYNVQSYYPVAGGPPPMQPNHGSWTPGGVV
jgi:hypothetical protein